MKKTIFIFLLLIPTVLLSQQMNIVSFNIRYNTQNDGENAWPNRIEMVTGLLKFHEADIFGLQEALHGQILDVENEMPGYEWFGVGRDDGKKGGEFSPIFYQKAKFELLDHGTFWLSETPEKPSTGWDAALNRIVTWGILKSTETGKEFMVFNTHFDHVGVEARKNSAILIREKIQKMVPSNTPVIVTGDFNLTPDQKPIEMLKDYLDDSRDITKEPPYGPAGTYNGFDINADLSSRRIDYIFVKGDIEVLKYAALSEIKDKRFPSDHLPVFAKVRLK
ncbi:MAG: endonuclease/exonuclease/phosphatase family protein [Bacteroidota bacterium]